MIKNRGCCGAGCPDCPFRPLPKPTQHSLDGGGFFLDKNTNVLYIFDGNEWLEIVPTSVLKNKTND